MRTFRLRLFGAPSLELDGTLLTGRPTQRHRLALLALVALAPDRRLSRDKLIAWLWPERGPEGGRNLLKVTTYVLRTALGDDALLSVGDELRLNPEVVEVDVAEFEDALARGDHARVVELHRAPFLDGFFLSEAPEFERWASTERERLARGYRTALEALADGAEAARDYGGAVEWWKVRAVHDPYDSRVALRLMQALEASGNRAGALQHAAVHQRMLQAEFGMEAAPEITRLAERLRREPAEVARPSPEPRRRESAHEEGRVVDLPMVTPAASAGARRRLTRPALGVAASAAVLVVAGTALWPRAAGPEPSIVVLPFVNLSADAENEYFSDGLTEEIITRLTAVPGLKVISRTSAMHYKATQKSLPEIAAELDVDHVLAGSVRQSDGRARISAQLVDARDDGQLWADSYEHDLNDSFRVQEEIAQEVARALEVRLGARARRLLARQGTRDPEAYELYRRGRFVWNTRTREGHEHALQYFERAIERDSSYADAYAGIADVYLTAFQLNLFDMPEADAYSRLKWAAERALALDDESADAHTSFAMALWWQRNWPGAAREFGRAIELNPGHATAHSWYSLLLRGMGRSAEALRVSRRAQELDPFAVVVVYNHAWQCYLARDYDCALEQYRRSLDITEYPSSWRGLGMVHALTGRADEAVAAVERARALAPRRTDFVADHAFVQARAGRIDEARATLREAKARPLEAFNIARAHVALGEPDSAFAWLERSNWRWPHRAVRDDPALDPLRADPRFTQLDVRIEREMGMR